MNGHQAQAKEPIGSYQTEVYRDIVLPKSRHYFCFFISEGPWMI